MLRRSLILVSALAGAFLLGPAAAVADGGPSGWLELDAGPAGEVHRLTPGGSADWEVDVRVLGEPAQSLHLGLQSEAVAAGSLRDFLTVGLRSCSQQWVGNTCPGSQRVLMEPAALATAEGVRVDLMEPGSFEAASAHVLVTATLAEDVPGEVQGSRTHIVVGVHGSGDNGGGAGTGGDGAGGNAGNGTFPEKPAGPTSGALADTGARLGGFAFLALVAVVSGFGLARLRGAGT
ncbi:hypothetical protein [Paenarthrobacter nitroguajacolicus]|uniref:hypothetical protein n=1 Tax=Paenarthrobacter nitroguajacolicus TaxID=211146 RepID=UPI0028621411|nr:hypothetical protein [Paenarthrobacter nitroguajacolicus]MDR6640399.1 hypothetical protein [Paenarthrobacter nitroguajacolicus]